MKSNTKKKTGNVFGPGEGLYQRTVRSGAWAFALRVAERVLGILRLAVLARLLGPGDFGILGIALLTMGAMETFSETGFHAALVQKKGETKEYLNPTWTITTLRGLILCAIICLAAPVASSFFDAPEATPIIRAVGLAAVLRGITNPRVIYFQKELEFRKQFVYIISGALVDFAVAVSAAVILKSVWALVLGVLAGGAARLAVGYVISPYRPRWDLDLAKARELFRFGKWILASVLLSFLLLRGDAIVVGRVLGVLFLGLYQMAYQLGSLPTEEINRVITEVAFPAFSRIQDDRQGLREGYLRMSQISAFISVPVAGGIFLVAPEFTRIFLGLDWVPMVTAMQLLALWGVLRPVGQSAVPMLWAVGKPDIAAKLIFARLALLAVLVYPLTVKWGIPGTAAAVLASACCTQPFGLYIVVTRVLNGGMLSLLKTAMLIPLVCTGLMMLALSFFVGENATLSAFVLHILGGAALYFALTYVFDRLLKYGVWDNLAWTAGGLK